MTKRSDTNEVTFTNDDLQRLKNGGMSVDEFNRKCPALLARLEAGEDLLSDIAHELDSIHIPEKVRKRIEIATRKAVARWRRAAGR